MNKIFSIAVLAMFTTKVFAGGLLTNTNQSASFLRNPAQDAVISPDAVYSNPAGSAFLKKGFHLAINWQAAFQQRQVESTFSGFAYGQGNDGKSTKTYTGKAQAPVIPSLQAIYKIDDRWAVSLNFALGGGGGKCTFDKGLGSFESQVALLPMVGQDMGINAYSVESYMKGQQYYFGLQLGASCKINEHFSAYVGGRVVYANCNYYGYVRNIKINNAEGTMVSAPATFSAMSELSVAQALQEATLAKQAIEAGNMEEAAHHQALAEKAQETAVTTGTLAVATSDVTLNCDQTAWGFTPIIGIDAKFDKVNIAAKYEFRTRLDLKNRSANSESAKNLESLAAFADGKKVRGDIAGYLATGVQVTPIECLRLNVGYHWFNDKKAQEGDDNRQKALKHDTHEVLAGVEFDILKWLQVSAGWQMTMYGMSDDYMRDMSFNVSSNSLGVGLGFQVAPRCKINVAYLRTFYQHYTKESVDYNGVSKIVTLAAGEKKANALVDLGYLSGKDVFWRKNQVFGVSAEISF